MKHFGFSGKTYLDEKKSQSMTGYKCSQTDIHIQIWTNIYMTFFSRDSSDQIIWIDLSNANSFLPNNQSYWKTNIFHGNKKGLGSIGNGKLWRFPVYSHIQAVSAIGLTV